jgi:hypothetical protein
MSGSNTRSSMLAALKAALTRAGSKVSSFNMKDSRELIAVNLNIGRNHTNLRARSRLRKER